MKKQTFIAITLLLFLNYSVKAVDIDKETGGVSAGVILTQEFPECWFSPTHYYIDDLTEWVDFQFIRRDIYGRVIEYKLFYKKNEDGGVVSHIYGTHYNIYNQVIEFKEDRKYYTTENEYFIKVDDIDYDFYLVDDFDVKVTPAEGNTIPPEHAPIEDEIAMEGSAYTGPTPVLEKGTLPVTYSLKTSPTGMTIDSATGVAFWENPVYTSKPYEIKIKAENVAGTDNIKWFLTVEPQPDVPVLPVFYDDSALENTPYTAMRVQMIQGTEPITFSLIQAPAGMAIDEEGTIRWAAPLFSPDPYDVIIRAENVAGFDVISYQLTVNPRVIPNENVFVHLQTNLGNMILELFPTEAPISTENFQYYVNENFYDGLLFHRVLTDVLIQAGGYDETLSERITTKPPIINESDNGLSNLQGTVAMWRLTDPNSATSQFYINHQDNTDLDRENAADGFGNAVFGHVVAGLGTAKTIAQAETEYINPTFSNLPISPIVLEQARQFHPEESSDFDEVPYLHAKPGMVRSFLGQADLRETSFIQQFSQQQIFGVNCLRIDETEIVDPQYIRSSSTILCARDIAGFLWLFKWVVNQQTVFEAEAIGQIAPFDTFADMKFRLMSQTVEIGDEIVNIFGVTQTIQNVLSDTIEVRLHDGSDTDWQYYSEPVGLFLDLEDDAGDTQQAGWYLLQERPIDITKVSFTKGNKPLTDSAKINYEILTIPSAEAIAEVSKLTLRIGLYTYELDINDPDLSISDSKIKYKGYPLGDQEKLTFELNRKNGKVTITLQNSDFIGLRDPVPIQIIVGDYIAAGISPVLPDKPLSVCFLQNDTDTLNITKHTLKVSEKVNADTLSVKGNITFADTTMDLVGSSFIIHWGQYTALLPVGSFTFKNNIYQAKNIPIDAIGTAKVKIDLNKCTYEIELKKVNIVEQDLPLRFRLITGDFDQSYYVNN